MGNWQIRPLGWWFGIAILMKGTTFGLNSQDQKHLSQDPVHDWVLCQLFFCSSVSKVYQIYQPCSGKEHGLGWGRPLFSSPMPEQLSDQSRVASAAGEQNTPTIWGFILQSYKSHGLWISFYPSVVSLKQLANCYRFYRWPIDAIYIHLPSSSFDGLH